MGTLRHFSAGGTPRHHPGGVIAPADAGAEVAGAYFRARGDLGAALEERARSGRARRAGAGRRRYQYGPGSAG
ncbi:MAG TPA: hypothetical protein VMF65_10705 [Acidimicrobiales bacterium]|nr:hypothetical protein [Acidimicrobiales bacterium]